MEAYFSDDVLIYSTTFTGSATSGKQDSYTYGLLTILTSAIVYPFATIEVLTENEFYFRYDVSGPLDTLENAGYRRAMKVRSFISYKVLSLSTLKNLKNACGHIQTGDLSAQGKLT